MGLFSAFSAPGRWFRGNCHTHTNLSDGAQNVQEVISAYRRSGYDFLVITDHGRTQPSVKGLSLPDFLVINGIELHPPALHSPGTQHHIVGIAIERAPDPEWVKQATAAAVVRWIWHMGGIPIYAHPYWSGHDLRHMCEAPRAFGVEVFNTVCEATRGIGNAGPHADQALSNRLRWRLFATDDMHRLGRDTCGGWIMVKAPRLTQRDILSAILKGHFYSTQGPRILSLRARRGRIELRCSPVRRVVWHGEGPSGHTETGDGRLLTSSSFSLERLETRTRYLRVEITDAEGRTAWSNPIWWNARRRSWVE